MPKPKRRVELHFIGEHHAADYEIPRSEATLSRLRKALDESRRSGKKTVVALEMTPELVERLKKFREFDREVERGDVEREFGENYGWLKDYANIMREYKDVEFRGIDIDTEKKEERAGARNIARNNFDFIDKAMSDNVQNRLTDYEKELVDSLAETLGRNEMMKLNINQALGVKKKDKLIYVGGSAHSTIVKNVKDELKRHGIEVKGHIEHNFGDELNRYTGNLKMVLEPHDALLRMVDTRKLEGLSHDEIVDIIKKMSELQRWHKKTKEEHEKMFGEYSFVAYQAASRGIGLREKRTPPSKELLDFVKKRIGRVSRK